MRDVVCHVKKISFVIYCSTGTKTTLGQMNHRGVEKPKKNATLSDELCLVITDNGDRIRDISRKMKNTNHS